MAENKKPQYFAQYRCPKCNNKWGNSSSQVIQTCSICVERTFPIEQVRIDCLKNLEKNVIILALAYFAVCICFAAISKQTKIKKLKIYSA